MTPPDISGKNKPADDSAALTGVDRLFGRDLRSRGWTLKLAPVVEPPATDRPETEDVSDAKPDPAMIWALRWHRK